MNNKQGKSQCNRHKINLPVVAKYLGLFAGGALAVTNIVFIAAFMSCTTRAHINGFTNAQTATLTALSFIVTVVSIFVFSVFNANVDDKQRELQKLIDENKYKLTIQTIISNQFLLSPMISNQQKLTKQGLEWVSLMHANADELIKYKRDGGLIDCPRETLLVILDGIQSHYKAVANGTSKQGFFQDYDEVADVEDYKINIEKLINKLKQLKQ